MRCPYCSSEVGVGEEKCRECMWPAKMIKGDILVEPETEPETEPEERERFLGYHIIMLVSLMVPWVGMIAGSIGMEQKRKGSEWLFLVGFIALIVQWLGL